MILAYGGFCLSLPYEKKPYAHNRHKPGDSDDDASWKHHRHCGKAGRGVSYRLCGICLLRAYSAARGDFHHQADNEGT